MDRGDQSSQQQPANEPARADKSMRFYVLRAARRAGLCYFVISILMIALYWNSNGSEGGPVWLLLPGVLGLPASGLVFPSIAWIFGNIRVDHHPVLAIFCVLLVGTCNWAGLAAACTAIKYLYDNSPRRRKQP
jgi:hypothetical protein